MHTILAVDDDPSALKMIQDELEQRGYRVVTANNGTTARAYGADPEAGFDRHGCGHADERSGIKAFDNLQAAPETQRIPVIFMTGVPSSTIYPTVEQGTRVAHLKKPVDLTDLTEMIERFIKLQSPQNKDHLTPHTEHVRPNKISQV